MVNQVNDNNFPLEVINSNETVVVDFWAPWCGPCKMLSPVLDEISGELTGKAKFVKVNVDENPVVSSQFRIASIPTVMVFKGGKVVDTMVGFRPKQSIKSLIENHI
jgi:thioredoxin 1